jgi:hypothetical protein
MEKTYVYTAFWSSVAAITDATSVFDSFLMTGHKPNRDQSLSKNNLYPTSRADRPQKIREIE